MKIGSILIKSFAMVGYLSLATLLLQALSLIIIAILQYAVLNHIAIEKSSENISSSAIPYYYAIPFHQFKPETPNTLLTLVLWIALVITLAFIAAYVSRLLSAAMRRISRSLYHKINLQTLLTTKILIAGVAIGVISFVALLLPAVEYILPFNISLLAVCTVSFGLQHLLIKRYKVSFKKVL